jgi:hypothetical protein
VRFHTRRAGRGVSNCTFAPERGHELQDSVAVDQQRRDVLVAGDVPRRGSQGWQRELMGNAGDCVADIEGRWSDLVGAKNFAQMCRTMQGLLDKLDPEQSRS